MNTNDALIVCRILQDLSSVVLWGGFGYLTTLVPPTLAATIADRLNLLRIFAILIALVATLAVLPLEAANLGDGWVDVFNPIILKSVVFESSIGKAWAFQSVAAAGLFITLFLRPIYQIRATALFAGLLLATRALVGHSVMRNGAVGDLLQINYLIHVLVAGAWLGALVPLVLVLLQLGDSSHARDSSLALRRFSAAGQVVVVLTVATGLANSLLILGHLPFDLTQSYQRLLIIKVSIVGAMIAIALMNRFVIVPRVKIAFRSSQLALLYLTSFEFLLGIGVLVLVNVFGTYDPVWRG
jgi:copper resistance protein D